MNTRTLRPAQDPVRRETDPLDLPDTDIPDTDFPVDPQQLIGVPFAALDDRIPLLLLPIRIETRFSTNPVIDLPTGEPSDDRVVVRSQLLIRIYPDQIHLDPSARSGRAALLPGQWVAAGYAADGTELFRRGSRAVRADLRLAPDGTATPEQISGVQTDPQIAWLLDYDAAVEAGMAITVDLTGITDDIATLLVFGVDDSRTPAQSADELSRVLAAYADAADLGFVAQGTPTNNTASVTSGWPVPALVETTGAGPQDQAARLDATLGLDSVRTWRDLPGGRDTEWADARAMRLVLFEATFGVLLRRLLDVEGENGVTPTAIAEIHDWFCDHVPGGAPVPCLRVGRQPYGILPVQRDRVAPDPATTAGQVDLTTRLLAGTWRTAAMSAPVMNPDATDQAGDADDAATGSHTADLGSILAAQPHPGRLFLRSIDAFDDLSTVQLIGTPQRQYEIALSSIDLSREDISPTQAAVGTLWELFSLDAGPLNTVDDEIARWGAVQLALPGWLDSTGIDDPDDLAAEQVEAILAQLRKYATRQPPLNLLPLEEFVSALSETDTELIQARFSADMREWGDRLLVEASDAPAGRRAADYLADLSRRVAGRDGDDFPGPDLDADFLADPPLLYQLIDQTLTSLPSGQAITDDVVEALDRLALLEPDGLTWLLRETLGLGSNRLDAWHTSLAADRIDRLRERRPTGIAIGGFGWVTDLAPRDTASPSEGYLLAPSLGQGATAAVLRSGYQAHEADDPASAYAVSVTSERVRSATWLLDGIRTGQPLGALLGYHLERLLHDADADEQIRILRTAVLDATGRPDAEPDQPVDGIAVLDLFRAKALGPLAASAKTAITALEETFDAVTDVGTFEAVHQLTSGNAARAAAMLDTLALGIQPPPELRAIRTPRHGISVDHRVLVLWVESDSLGPESSQPTSGWASGGRADVAPGLDRWLAGLLPDPASIGFLVDGVPTRLDALALSALDAVGLCSEDPGRAGAALTTLAGGTIDPTDAGDAPISLAEFTVTAVELRRVIAKARVADDRDLRTAAAAGEPSVDHRPGVRAAGRLVAGLDRQIDGLAAAIEAGDRRRVRAVTAALARLGIAVPGDAADALLALAQRVAAQVAAITVGPREPVAGWESRLVALLGHRVPLPATFELPTGAGALDISPGLATGVEIETWLDDVGQVRADVGRLCEALCLAGLLAPDRVVSPVAGQAPRAPREDWAAITAPASGTGGRTSAVLLTGGVPLTGRVAGLVVDQWTELIPAATEAAALTFHFDSPSNRPPQTWLLAATPPGEEWSLDLVSATLRETLDWMRIRAVGPEDLGDFGRAIPTIFVNGSVSVPELAGVPA